MGNDKGVRVQEWVCEHGTPLKLPRKMIAPRTWQSPPLTIGGGAVGMMLTFGVSHYLDFDSFA